MKREIIIFGLALAMGLLLFVHRLETGGDNLDFMLQARAAMQGNWADVLAWYRPPGYALLLAGVLRAAGIELAAGPLQVPSPVFYGIGFMGVVMYALCAVAVFRWALAVSRDASVAAGVALLFAANQTLAAWSSVVAAETLLSLLAFVALSAWESRDRGGRWNLVVFAVCVAVGLFVRSVAMALVGAIGLWVIVHRAFAWRYLATAGAVGLAALAAVLQIVLRSRYYLSHIVASDPYGFGEPVTWGERIRAAANTYVHAWPDLLVPKIIGYRGILELVGLEGLGTLVIGSLLALSIAGFVRTVRREGWLLSHLYLLTYLAMLFIWPDFLARYMFPLVPLGLWIVLEGVMGLAAWAGPRWRLAAVTPARAVHLFVALALAWGCAINLFAGAKNWRNIVRLGASPIWDPRRYEATGELDFADYVAAALWIKEHAPADAVVLCRKAHYIELISGRSAMNYSAYNRAEEVWQAAQAAAAERPCLILQDAFGAESTYGRIRKLRLDPAIAAHASQLEMLHATDYGAVIYRVR